MHETEQPSAPEQEAMVSFEEVVAVMQQMYPLQAQVAVLTAVNQKQAAMLASLRAQSAE